MDHAIPSQTDEARILTWRQADELSPYNAFDLWRKLAPAALHEDEPEHHLEDLALMTVAAQWLTRWQPIAIHRAILAGATPAQVCEAAGAATPEVFDRWHRWAETQRHRMLGGRPVVSEEAYTRVLGRFANASAGLERR
jgi:hypothetical protein